MANLYWSLWSTIRLPYITNFFHLVKKDDLYDAKYDMTDGTVKLSAENSYCRLSDGK